MFFARSNLSLGTYYKFKQYEKQNVKSNSILFGTLPLKAQNDNIF